MQGLLASNTEDAKWKMCGWGVRARDARSAAVHIKQKHRLPQKILEERPVTLTGRKCRNKEVNNVKGLSGREEKDLCLGFTLLRKRSKEK